MVGLDDVVEVFHLPVPRVLRALAGPAEAVAEQVVRLQMRERLGAPTRAVAQDPRHRKRRVVVEDRARNPAEEGLGRLPGIGLDEPDVGMGQDQAEEGNLLPSASDLDRRLAEVDLGMAWRVMERNESLARRLPAGTHIVLHDGIAAGEPVLVAKTLEDPVRRVTLSPYRLPARPPPAPRFARRYQRTARPKRARRRASASGLPTTFARSARPW